MCAYLCSDGLFCAWVLLIFQVSAKVFQSYFVQVKSLLVVSSIVLSDCFLDILCNHIKTAIT